MLTMGVLLAAVTATGLDIVGIDGGFLKHPHMKDFVYLVLVAITCDGNNLPIGVAIVPAESGKWVSWFIDCMCEMGWGTFLDTHNHAPVLSRQYKNAKLVCIMDRGKGLIKSVRKLNHVKIRHCFKHIERNIIAAIHSTKYWKIAALLKEIQVMIPRPCPAHAW